MSDLSQQNTCSSCLVGEQLWSTSAFPSVSFTGLWRQLMLFRGEALGLRQLPYLDYYSSGTRRGREGRLATGSTLGAPPYGQVTSLPLAPPPGFSSSACQVLQITTHANKSLETRTAIVGLPWRPTPGTGSPGGWPMAQVY